MEESQCFPAASTWMVVATFIFVCLLVGLLLLYRRLSIIRLHLDTLGEHNRVLTTLREQIQPIGEHVQRVLIELGKVQSTASDALGKITDASLRSWNTFETGMSFANEGAKKAALSLETVNRDLGGVVGSFEALGKSFASTGKFLESQTDLRREHIQTRDRIQDLLAEIASVRQSMNLGFDEIRRRAINDQLTAYPRQLLIVPDEREVDLDPIQFLDGPILSSSEPTAISPPSQDYVNFMPEFDSANKQERAEWIAIMAAVRNATGGRVLLSVGNSSSREAFVSEVYVPFKLYPSFYGIAFVLVLWLLGVLVWLGWTTNLLRDPGGTVGTLGSLPRARPFSLARVQMAWWFYLVVTAYVYICLVTKVSEVPTGSVLALLGISATTGLAAVSLDKNKRYDPEIERTNLVTEQQELEKRIDEIRKQGTNLEATSQQELQTKESRLAEVRVALARQSLRVAPVSSKGFFWDLMTAGDGVSFHRFQMVVWTVVLGLVFAWQVYRDFSMPEFDPSLLALMGVYSGTYVGFKFPEKLMP